MPKPAPARFDHRDRRTLWTSALGAVGPALAMVVLVAGYCMSAHLCQASNKSCIAGLIAFGVTISACALLCLARAPREPVPLRFLIWLGIALEAFSICVLLAFALALATQVRCE